MRKSPDLEVQLAEPVGCGPRRGGLSETTHGAAWPSSLRGSALWVALIALTGCSPLEPPASATSDPPIAPSASPVSSVSQTDPATATIAAATETTQVCKQAEGAIEAGTYPAVAVPGELPYLIYLPPCYPELGRAYPAVYLLHGYPYDEQHWLELGAEQAANQGLAEGNWPPFLMVMPLQPDPLFRNSDGGPGSYETELLDGIVSYVDRVYRSDPSRRGLAGVSRGGVWALEIAFRNPSDFQAVAALSPALAVNSARPPYDPFEIVKSAGNLPGDILLIAGDEDWAASSTERLSAALEGEGFPHTFRLVQGDHSDPTWAGAMPQILAFFAWALAGGP
ncbi:MAG: alpha/beta hydrolase [Anaerolineales bacterium]